MRREGPLAADIRGRIGCRRGEPRRRHVGVGRTVRRTVGVFAAFAKAVTAKRRHAIAVASRAVLAATTSAVAAKRRSTAQPLTRPPALTQGRHRARRPLVLLRSALRMSSPPAVARTFPIRKPFHLMGDELHRRVEDGPSRPTSKAVRRSDEVLAAFGYLGHHAARIDFQRQAGTVSGAQHAVADVHAGDCDANGSPPGSDRAIQLNDRQIAKSVGARRVFAMDDPAARVHVFSSVER